MLQSEFYGDQHRWFVGVVEQVGGDVPRLGRVRVRIRGIHGTAAEVPLADLPWASVLIPGTEGGVSGIGRAPGLRQGAQVYGHFLDGKGSQLPLILGSISNIETPSSAQLGGGLLVDQRAAVYGNQPNLQSPAVSANSAENIRLGWNWFKATGNYQPPQIAAMLGNFMHESKMNPSIHSGIVQAGGNLENSVGIAQWYWAGSTGGRQARLRQFASEHGKPWDDLYLQFAFVDYELASDASVRGGEFKQQRDVVSATLHFVRYYERPALSGGNGPDGIPIRLGQNERIAYAQGIYSQYMTGSGPAPSNSNANAV